MTTYFLTTAFVAAVLIFGALLLNNSRDDNN